MMVVVATLACGVLVTGVRTVRAAGGHASAQQPPAQSSVDTAGGVASQGPAALDGMYAGDTMAVILRRAGLGYVGEIRRGQQRFELTATAEGGNLRGEFRSGDQPFALTASLDGEVLTLRTGGATYVLKRVDAAMAPPLAPPAAAQVPPAPAATGPGLVPTSRENLILRSVAIHDEMFNCDAVRLLVPANWQAQGKTIWRGHLLLPCTFFYTVCNPQSREALTVYPLLTFCEGIRESTMRMVQRTGLTAGIAQVTNEFRDGAFYLGNEIRPCVRGPAEYLQEILIPRCRKDLVSAGFRVTGVQEVPDLRQFHLSQVQGVPALRTQSARVRIEYAIGSEAIEEDFYVLLCAQDGPRGKDGMVGYVNWAGDVTSYRARKGALDQAFALLHAIESSTEVTPEIINYNGQVAARANQEFQQRSTALMEVVRIRSEMNSRFTETVLASARANREAMDRRMEQQSRYMRGVEVYDKPGGSRVEVPSGYSHVFMNNNNEVIATNDSWFKPSSGNWTEIHRSATK